MRPQESNSFRVRTSRFIRNCSCRVYVVLVFQRIDAIAARRSRDVAAEHPESPMITYAHVGSLNAVPGRHSPLFTLDSN